MSTTTTPVKKILLNKTMREVFVSSVLADINTSIDDDAYRKIVVDEAVAKLPKEIQQLWKNPALKHFVATVYVSFDRVYCRIRKDHRGFSSRPCVYAQSVMVPGGPTYVPSDGTKAKIAKILQAHADLLDEKEDLKEKLTAIVKAVKTTEELEELYPLLTKYIPKPTVPVLASVPMVLVKDSMKELRRLGVPPKQQVVAAAA